MPERLGPSPQTLVTTPEVLRPVPESLRTLPERLVTDPEVSRTAPETLGTGHLFFGRRPELCFPGTHLLPCPCLSSGRG